MPGPSTNRRALLAAVRCGQGLLWAPLGYLAALSALGLREPRRPPPGERTTSFVVLVPAHDEEGHVAATVESILAVDYPEGGRRVVVVADNCADATANMARQAGAEVWERRDPSNPGKGAALGWALERLLTQPGWNAAVIFDADSIVDRDFLAAADARLSRGAQVVQGLYGVANPTENVLSRLSDVSYASETVMRPRGRARLGAAAKLQGNGMVFSRGVLERHPWRAQGLTEDVEYWFELLGAGVAPVYEPSAMVAAMMPVRLDEARVQRFRWAAGHRSAVRRHLLPGLRRAVARRDPVLAEAVVFELVFPRLSSLAGLVLGGAGARWALERRAGVGPVQAAVLTLHIAAALRAARAPAATWATLVLSPGVVAWQLLVRLETAVAGRRARWQRTPRGSSA